MFNKDECVSIDVTLHFPGSQFNYVRNVTLQVIFENKDGCASIRSNSATSRYRRNPNVRFGRMSLITNEEAGSVGFED
jgi:hypothetical protein